MVYNTGEYEIRETLKSENQTVLNQVGKQANNEVVISTDEWDQRTDLPRERCVYYWIIRRKKEDFTPVWT
jgi:hypothetical protein